MRGAWSRGIGYGRRGRRRRRPHGAGAVVGLHGAGAVRPRGHAPCGPCTRQAARLRVVWLRVVWSWAACCGEYPASRPARARHCQIECGPVASLLSAGVLRPTPLLPCSSAVAPWSPSSTSVAAAGGTIPACGVRRRFRRRRRAGRAGRARRVAAGGGAPPL